MFGKSKMGNLLSRDFGASSHNNRGEAATTIPHFSFLISHSSFLIRAELSSALKERHVPWANPEPLSLPAQILYNFIDTFYALAKEETS